MSLFEPPFGLPDPLDPTGPLYNLSDAAPANPRPRPPASEVGFSELKAECERLLIISEALWRILKEKHGLEDNEIVRQITMIDLEDGKLDGRKAATPPQPCPKCGRILGKHRPRCIFCGEPIAARPFDR